MGRHHAGLGIHVVHVRIVEVGGYALQLLTIGGPVDEEGLRILRPGPAKINGWSIELMKLGDTLHINPWNSQTAGR